MVHHTEPNSEAKCNAYVVEVFQNLTLPRGMHYKIYECPLMKASGRYFDNYEATLIILSVFTKLTLRDTLAYGPLHVISCRTYRLLQTTYTSN